MSRAFPIAILLFVAVRATAENRPSYWEKDQGKMKGWVEGFGCDMAVRTWDSLKTKDDVWYKLGTVENAIADCNKYVQWATEDGLDPKTKIKCYDRELEFKDVKAQVCDAYYKHVSSLYPPLAERETKCKAIRDQLSGDKLRWFTGEAQSSSNPGCHGLDYFHGKGGRVLKTPADFKSEPVWFKYTVDRTGSSPRWEMLRIPFSGMKEAGRQSSSSAIGEDPPNSAYR